jgi:hypothetical protein
MRHLDTVIHIRYVQYCMCCRVEAVIYTFKKEDLFTYVKSLVKNQYTVHIKNDVFREEWVGGKGRYFSCLEERK